MGRWGAGLWLVLIACCALIVLHASSPAMLRDTDTAVLLTKIQERNDPVSWFSTDWPLENGFYRPVSTLSLSLEQSLFGPNPRGYGLMNAFLAGLAVLTLFWFARELTDSAVIATGAALLYASWHMPWAIAWHWLALGIGSVVAVAGVLRHGMNAKHWLPAVFVAAYLPIELYGAYSLQVGQGFGQSILGWIPARTAVLATIFALAALAAYARFERLSAKAVMREPSPLDPPATRTTSVAMRRPFAFLWAMFAVLFLALALGSHEQAVVVPGLLTVAALVFAAKGLRVRWAWIAIFWAMLLGYVAWRSRILPLELSEYQRQQLRGGPSVVLALLAYVAPAFVGGYLWLSTFAAGPMLLLTAAAYRFPAQALGNVSAYVAAKRNLPLAGGAWALSFVAFLPMAWLKPFPHYHYLPMALRSVFVMVLVWTVWNLFVTAASRPVQQAPERLSPAPGSLPRP